MNTRHEHDSHSHPTSSPETPLRGLLTSVLGEPLLPLGPPSCSLSVVVRQWLRGPPSPLMLPRRRLASGLARTLALA